jgi:hypothetical protein
MKFVGLLLLLSFLLPIHSQTGGSYSFPFLNLDYSARTAATGGYFMSNMDDDINLGLSNPSVLNEKMHQAVAFSQAFLAGGINYGMAAYAQKGLKGICSANVKYVDYGTFQGTEANGQSTGTFRPFEYVIGLGYGKQLNPVISVGGNFNFIGSNLETYSAYGMSIDLSGTFSHPNKLFSATALFKNAGFKLSNYTSNDRGILPADLQLGFSYKLAHAPFRFYLVLHHLNQWDLTYNDPFALPTYDALTGDTIPVAKANFVEKLARHLSLSTELSVSKSLFFRLGFNYQRRQEMKIETRPGMAGFSLGIGVKTKRFRLDYGYVIYSKAGSNSVISLSSSLGKWKKR